MMTICMKLNSIGTYTQKLLIRCAFASDEERDEPGTENRRQKM